MLAQMSDLRNAADDDVVILLEGISKEFRAVRALDEVSLSIGRGVTGLLGPNGAGKSTLIKILMGLVAPTRGRGQVLGFDLVNQSKAIRDLVGFMPEDDCFIPGLTGIEMVQFAAQLAGLPPTEGLRRAHEILDFSGAQQERYRTVETYSTGMRQKLKFAQAVVHDPQLLIFDEPTAGLDPEERTAMLSRIRVLSKRLGKTTVICTHILPDVQATCDHVVIMGAGRILVSERLDQLSRPAEPSFTVRVWGEVAPLANRLNAAGAVAEIENLSTAVVRGSQADLTENIWEAARHTSSSIRSLHPAKISLEKIFVDAVQGGRRAAP